MASVEISGRLCCMNLSGKDGLNTNKTRRAVYCVRAKFTEDFNNFYECKTSEKFLTCRALFLVGRKARMRYRSRFFRIPLYPLCQRVRARQLERLQGL